MFAFAVNVIQNLSFGFRPKNRKRRAKKKIDKFQKASKNKAHLIFFVCHFIKQTGIFFCCIRKLSVLGCTFLVTTTYM